MGYTNYWHQKRSFTDKEWEQIFNEYLYVLDLEMIEPIQLENKKAIAFNGKGSESCETFILTKNLTREPIGDGLEHFNFCKTNRNPYDKVVWKLLKFIKFVVLNPNDKSFKISNDNGDEYE